MAETVTPNATCLFCGCVCDDIVVHADQTRVLRAEHACSIGEAWFRGYTAERLHPDALIDGQPASLESAVAAAAEVLVNADHPLIYGLGNLTSEAQREAVHLAEIVGGTIDSQSSFSHGSAEIASQMNGKLTCTLGEVMNRADLVIYWGCNPAESHPRHFTKYSLMPAGTHTPGGRKDRTMILVDVRDTPSAAAADINLRITPGADFEVLTTLRALIRGGRIREDAVTGFGITLGELRDLADRMKRARYGVLFFGTGLPMTRGKYMNSAAIMSLTLELAAFTRFFAMPMRGHGNVTGSDVVLRYLTGYPFGVNLSRGYPRYNPGEYTAIDLLARGEVDAALVAGADPAASMPQKAIDQLAKIPTIVLAPRVTHTSRLARVHITTAVSGISTAGTAYRMDRVPLPLRPALVSPYPADESVLKHLARNALAKRK
jgi:formylmethanofuran dehydrogenase subunit B